MRARPLEVITADGERLDADLLVPDRVRGTAVVCHPHPRYGGDRTNPVVTALCDAFVGAGLATVRFDFRGTGRSTGAHGGGVAEHADVLAALDAALDATREARLAARPEDPDTGGPDAPGPVIVAGYSFGSAVALSLVDPRITGWVAVALPLALTDAVPARALADGRPVLLVSPEHDQFSPASAVTAAAADWPAASVVAVPMADHFLAGGLRTVAQAAADFAAQAGG
ncbi:MAG: alpha/beta hydrolase [Acidimicrobiales bacterium]